MTRYAITIQVKNHDSKQTSATEYRKIDPVDLMADDLYDEVMRLVDESGKSK